MHSGIVSDVTVVVQGEEIQMHSFVLSARSEVFQRQLSSGMQETKSKEIIIEDSEPVIFKAFLRYLYPVISACLIVEFATVRLSMVIPGFECDLSCPEITS